eukprot:702837-Alexandrium_andersonii.AAC.1
MGQPSSCLPGPRAHTMLSDIVGVLVPDDFSGAHVAFWGLASRNVGFQLLGARGSRTIAQSAACAWLQMSP